MGNNALAWAGIAVIVLITFYLGYHGSRSANTTRDFLVARRRVSPHQNAAAIAGEFLSAASFIGIVGLVLKNGPDELWYAIGFTAGYLALLLFVAAPLRRSGAYTLPDFVEARLNLGIALQQAGAQAEEYYPPTPIGAKNLAATIKILRKRE